MSKLAYSDRENHTRPVELEDWLNSRIYHPLSYRLAGWLSATPVTPNMVSVAGGLMVVLAAFLYGWGAGIAGSLAALLLLVAWHVVDGADGDLARMTGRVSATGEIVDGLSDYASHLVLYIVLASILAESLGALGWMLMIGAGLARIVQTAFYESQRRQYQWWVHGKAWIGQSIDAAGPLRSVGALYLLVVRLLAAGGERVEERLAVSGDAGREALRAQVVQHVLPAIRSLSILSSNYRTLVIGVSMIAGFPMAIVAFELALLTLLLPVLRHRVRAAIGRALDGADAQCAANNSR